METSRNNTLGVSSSCAFKSFNLLLRSGDGLLGKKAFCLCQDYSWCRWILKADPEAGLEMFTQMGEGFAPRAALSVLTAQAPALCAPYLESALENGTASPSDYHNDLAGIYLRTLLKPDPKQTGKAPRPEPPADLSVTPTIDKTVLLIPPEAVCCSHKLTCPFGLQDLCAV